MLPFIIALEPAVPSPSSIPSSQRNDGALRAQEEQVVDNPRIEDPNQVEQAIFGMIAEVANWPLEELTPETSMDEVGIDSLLIVEVVVAIRRRFGVQVPPAEFRSDVRTVGDVCSVLGGYVVDAISGPPDRAMAV
jgi:acyl carrier protein